MKLLFGSTGLIGKTLLESEMFCGFNTKNSNDFNSIAENGDELYLCCLPAAKWQVNQALDRDIRNIEHITDIISKKRYSKVVLISTIDVYCESPLKYNEDYVPQIKSLNYGSNRYLFELFVRSFVKFDDLKIFRLPALYNKHIKKNILFDLLNNNNVDKININSSYQWYNLNNLWNDIKKYSAEYPKETIFNLFPEPIETKDIVAMFPEYNLTLFGNRVQYDYTTKLTDSGYIQTKGESLREIQEFINGSRAK
jgi:hypothetical protein